MVEKFKKIIIIFEAPKTLVINLTKNIFYKLLFWNFYSHFTYVGFFLISESITYFLQNEMLDSTLQQFNSNHIEYSVHTFIHFDS